MITLWCPNNSWTESLTQLSVVEWSGMCGMKRAASKCCYRSARVITTLQAWLTKNVFLLLFIQSKRQWYQKRSCTTWTHVKWLWWETSWTENMRAWRWTCPSCSSMAWRWVPLTSASSSPVQSTDLSQPAHRSFSISSLLLQHFLPSIFIFF